ncbi:uncharacterized protein LOC134264860 isoform X2 [Saccostrea cucullata]|uniref:uncharacterized protein LOC134264860 isoform X2 n=1 Tax=Saccostrea cuccullata TaxID=36930 RepID=UPI002ED67537
MFQQREYVNSFSLPCNLSTQTLEHVKSCPVTNLEWEQRAAKKQCHLIKNDCKGFTYHCVLNSMRTSLLEVCASPIKIIGGKCANYDEGYKSIRSSFLSDCSQFKPPCPNSYSSEDSYKYAECYGYVMESFTTTTSSSSPSPALLLTSLLIPASSTIMSSKNLTYSLHINGTLFKPKRTKHGKGKSMTAIFITVAIVYVIVLTVVSFLMKNRGPSERNIVTTC